MTVDLASLVRSRRKALGLSQRELSELAAGCGTAFLYDVEHGKRSLRLDKLMDVLEVLGLHLKVEQGGGGMTVDEELA
jgi:y4mF family transcriptional regulator